MIRIISLVSLFVLVTASYSWAEDPMKFRFASHGGTDGLDYIVADGQITEDTPKLFDEFLKREEDYVSEDLELYINSQGGNLNAALILGKMIRDHGFGTKVARSRPMEDPLFEEEVSGQCVSACSYMFLGGKTREADDKTIGVHQFYIPNKVYSVSDKALNANEEASKNQLIFSVLLSYIVNMGVDPRFIITASTVSSSDVHWLTTAEMDTFAVRFDKFEYTDWQLVIEKGALIARAHTKDLSKTATLYCRKSDKDVRVSISQPNEYDVKPTNRREGFSIFGKSIEDPNFSIKISKENRVIIDTSIIKISRDQELMEDAGLMLSASYRRVFNNEFKYKNVKEITAILKKSC